MKKMLSALVLLAGIFLLTGCSFFFVEGPASKEQLSYLKAHESEMAEFIKKQNSRVDSVQFLWDSTEVSQIGNGTPQGAGYGCAISGFFDNDKTTSFDLFIGFDDDGKINVNYLTLGGPLRKNGEIFSDKQE